MTGCDNVLGNALARRLDDIGYHVFAGFQNKTGNIDADMLKEDCSGRLHIIQLDITSETQVIGNHTSFVKYIRTINKIKFHNPKSLQSADYKTSVEFRVIAFLCLHIE